MNKPKPIVGQHLYKCVVKGTAASVTPMVVLSVGRKFFKADDRMRPQAVGAA